MSAPQRTGGVVEINRDAKKLIQAASKYSYVGIFFGVAIAVGHFAGHWLDGKLHTNPWLGFIGVILGTAAGFRELYRLAKQYEREEHDGT